MAVASDPAAAPAFAAARSLCRRHAKNIFFASALLPIAKRDAACAVLAFTRMMGEAFRQSTCDADVPAPATVGTSCCSISSIDQTLGLFRERLNELYDNRLALPLPEFRDESQHALDAFGRTVRRYQIPKQYFLDLAEGHRMDLTISRYATWASLEKYCYRSGGALGLIMSCILGVSHSGAGRQVAQMGNAMQLTRMLRDLKKDGARGRLYLPLEDLARFKVTQQDLAAGRVNDNFRELMRFEIARARELYRQGAEGLCWLEGDGSRLTACVIVVIFSGILGAIERQGYDVFSHCPRQSAARKFRQLAPAWRLARRRAEDPTPAVFVS